MDWPCVSAHGGRTRLELSVVPNARRTAIEGLHDGALRVRLAAPPVDGKANDALLRWLAAELDVPRRGLELVRGTSARRKAVEVDAPLQHLLAWLDRAVPTCSRQGDPDPP